SEQRLATGRTNRDGSYYLQYSTSQCQIPGPNLVVKVLRQDGSFLAASSVLFDAPASAQLDVTIPAEAVAPLSLFEKINQALAPLMSGLKVEDLEEGTERQDLSFLSGQTGFEIVTLARFALAHKLADRELPPEFWFALLGGSLIEFQPH